MCYKEACIKFMLGMRGNFYSVKKKDRDDNFPMRKIIKVLFHIDLGMDRNFLSSIKKGTGLWWWLCRSINL